jgi:adenosylcobinamide-GDP ribazoletransferase
MVFPTSVTFAILLTIWVLLTGALHFDGFLDTCDGLFGGRTPESRMRIMRDERVGAYAVIGGVLLILLKYACLSALVSRTAALIVAPTVARGIMAIAIVALPYARSEGLGRWMKDHAGWIQAILSLATLIAVAFIVAEWFGLLTVAISLAVATVGTLYVLRRLPGLTGDIYGAGCEIVELVVLLAFVAREKP